MFPSSIKREIEKFRAVDRRARLQQNVQKSMIRKCRVVVCQSNPTAFLPSSLLTMAINADLCSVIGQATFYIGVRRRCHVFAKSPRCYGADSRLRI